MKMEPKSAYFNRPALEEIQKRALDTGARKSHDYGRAGDGIAMAGVRGVVVRNLDKQLRCMSLTEPGHEQAVKDESLKDTLMDMINYCTYAVSLLEGTWGVRPQDPPAPSEAAKILMQSFRKCKEDNTHLRIQMLKLLEKKINPANTKKKGTGKKK